MPDDYQKLHEHSLSDPEEFWSQAAADIHWDKTWDRVLDSSRAPQYRWFPGGIVNTCYNSIDRHVEAGRGVQPALIHDSAMTGVKRTYSFDELLDQVAHTAGAMANLGIEKGDRVIIYMPMVPEAAIAMLACARLGAVHSVVFGGFAANELAARINDAEPKLIIAASCGLEPGRTVPYKPLLDAAIEQSAHKPQNCIILQRPELSADMISGRDLDWETIVSSAEPADCVPVSATDPLYILYTSGTTGQPKGIVRDNGGHAVALNWSMQCIYGCDTGDVFWAASDVGWVVGHSYIVYGPLLRGCTTVMYEGKPVGTPDAGAFWRIIEEHKVNALFTAPTAFRAIKREDPNGYLLKQHDLSSFRTLFLAGERCDPDTLDWASLMLKVPVIDHWWQTETGWAIAAIPTGISQCRIKPGSAGIPMPGWDVRVLDDEGHSVAAEEIGPIACRLPLPPGTLPTLWKADERFIEAYLEQFPGYYNTGDAGYIDVDGYVYVMTRTDDIINVAGHRLSTGAMEEVLASHPAVAECAVTGIHDELKGQVPLGFLCLKAGTNQSHQIICTEVIELVRERIGPVAAFKQAVVVDRLPKTRSGKILRSTLTKIADGADYQVPATIDDPAILDEIADTLQDARAIPR